MDGTLPDSLIRLPLRLPAS